MFPSGSRRGLRTLPLNRLHAVDLNSEVSDSRREKFVRGIEFEKRVLADLQVQEGRLTFGVLQAERSLETHRLRIEGGRFVHVVDGDADVIEHNDTGAAVLTCICLDQLPGQGSENENKESAHGHHLSKNLCLFPDNGVLAERSIRGLLVIRVDWTGGDKYSQ